MILASDNFRQQPNDGDAKMKGMTTGDPEAENLGGLIDMYYRHQDAISALGVRLDYASRDLAEYHRKIDFNSCPMEVLYEITKSLYVGSACQMNSIEHVFQQRFVQRLFDTGVLIEGSKVSETADQFDICGYYNLSFMLPNEVVDAQRIVEVVGAENLNQNVGENGAFTEINIIGDFPEGLK